MIRLNRLGITTAAGVALCVVTLSSCGKSASDNSPAGADAGQKVQETGGGEGCTYKTYNGGVPELDLTNTTIGFAQSEKEANPFRITETKQ